MNLTLGIKKHYNNSALAKSSVEFGDSDNIYGVHTPAFRLGVFLCLSVYMAVCAGRPQGLLGSVGTSSPTLRTLPPQFGDFGGDDLNHLSTESQMTVKNTCISAQDLIHQAKSASTGQVAINDLVATSPALLTSFIEIILLEFDYLQHQESNIALTLRAMAAMVYRFEQESHNG